MDGSCSAAHAAELLGTNVPRLLRAAQRLGLKPRRRGVGRGSRVELTPAEVERLRAALGVQPVVHGLSRVQVQVLAALARSARGVLSARSLAARAGVSPTTASHAVEELEERGLVVRETMRLPLGSVRDVAVLRADLRSPDWSRIAPLLRRVRPPERRQTPARRVPSALRHLFWNTSESQLDVQYAGDYIARRLIQVGDLDGLAWGADQLDASHWRHAARTRGLTPAMRALALNLAGDEH